MIRALLAKELRQHWMAFLGLGLLQGVSLLIVLAMMMRGGMTVSAFDPLRMVIGWFGAAGAMMLGHRLVAAEYSARTQLFLEALPLRRSTMLGAKAAVVLGLSFIGAVGLVGLAAILGWRHEHLTPVFVGLMLLRATLWNACAALFFCVLGLLGRYRWPVLIGTGLTLASAQQWFGLDPATWPPFSLLGRDFAFERHVLPVPEIQGAGLFLGACLLLGGLLGLVREGQVASLLAEKMSGREKVFLWIAAISIISVAVSKTDTAPPRFTLAGASRTTTGLARVSVAPMDEAAQKTADTAARALDGLAQYLGWTTLPEVLITLSGDLDGRTWQLGEFEDARRQGLPVRANFKHPDFDPRAFTAWLIPHVVRGATLGRAAHEPQRWALDGLGHFWLQHQDPADSPELLQRRALWAAPEGVSADTLRTWLRLRDRLGPEVAAGLSWSGLQTLEQAAGPEACQHLLTSLLRQPSRKDIRTTLRTLWHPARAQLREHTGWTLDEFAARWSRTLDSWRPAQADALARVPRLHAEYRFVSDGPGAARAQVRLLTPGLTTPTIGLEYATLFPADGEIPPSWIKSAAVPTDDSWHLAAATLIPGQRWAATVTLWSPELGCTHLSGWQRLTVHPEPMPPAP